jgi:hypothetical protein
MRCCEAEHRDRYAVDELAQDSVGKQGKTIPWRINDIMNAQVSCRSGICAPLCTEASGVVIKLWHFGARTGIFRLTQ